MTTEIARREPAATLPEKIEWATKLAASNLLPRQYQNNPANLLFAVEYADALGVSRINAITSIHVIEGKPSASADLIASLVRRAGHKLRISGDDSHAVAQLIRADDPEFTYEARWDIAKARAAGLLGKSVWKSYPGAMLRSRAITEVARMGASDSLFGVIYTPEELDAEVGEDGEVVHQVTTVRPPTSGAAHMRDMLGTTTSGQGAAAASRPGADPQATAEDGGSAEQGGGRSPSAAHPQDSEVPGITSAQVKKLAAAMNEAGITDRKDALAYVSDVIGRTVNSRNELTKDEASRVIDALERDGAQVVDVEVVDDAPPPDNDDPDAIWEQIEQLGRDLGVDSTGLRTHFEQHMALSPREASAGELATYLHHLQQNGVNAA